MLGCGFVEERRKGGRQAVKEKENAMRVSRVSVDELVKDDEQSTTKQRSEAFRSHRRRTAKVRTARSRRRVSTGANTVGIHRRRNKRSGW